MKHRHISRVTLTKHGMRTIAATALVAAATMGAYAQNEGWKQVVDNKNHTVTITLGEEFAQQDITEKLVNKTYKKIKKSLPRQYNKHKLIVSRIMNTTATGMASTTKESHGFRTFRSLTT